MELELLKLVQQYGATAILSVLCIKLCISLNNERKQLMTTLDNRTNVYIETIRDLISSQNNIVDRLDRIENKLK